MSATLSLTEAQVLAQLRNFLLSILPAGIEVFRAEINRVSEPDGVNFVEMTPLLRERLSTNVDQVMDVSVTGSITAGSLTVSAVAFGTLELNAPIYGMNVPAGISITSQTSGTPGGVGVYSLTGAGALSLASQALYAGINQLQQATKLTIQLDIHGPLGADLVQLISTLFRDDYAQEFFLLTGFDIAPLYHSEPRQAPFINGEQQYEFRWTMDLYLQVNPVVQVGQQFAASLKATPTSVWVVEAIDVD